MRKLSLFNSIFSRAGILFFLSGGVLPVGLFAEEDAEAKSAALAVNTIPESLRAVSEEHAKFEGLTTLHKKFVDTWAQQVDEKAIPALKELREQYINAVNAGREKAKASGDLTVTLAFTKERDEVTAGGLVPKPDPESKIEGLENLREVFHRSSRDIMSSMDGKRRELLEALSNSANELSVSLTKSDQLEAAVAAREFASSVDKARRVLAEHSIDVKTPVTGEPAAEVKPKKPPLKPIELPVLNAEDYLKNLNGLTRLLPINFELTQKGELDVEKMERLNLGLRPQYNRIGVWLVTLDTRDKTSMYGATEKLVSKPVKVSIGGREFVARVNIFHDNPEDFSEKKKSNTFEVVGRVGFCFLSAVEGGTLQLDFANARLKTPADANGIDIDRLPDIKIEYASYGSGGSRMNVTELVQEKLVFRHERVWATSGWAGGDPAPYWQKNMSMSFFVGEKKGSIGRHEGSSMTFEDLFIAVKDQKPK